MQANQNDEPVSARFGRVVTAMATPFDDEGNLDVDGAVRLARYLAANGSEGLAITGTTGEVSTLDDDERLTLYEAISKAVSIPVLAGTTSNDTRHSVELTRRAVGLGITGVLAVAPYYSRPSQAGIEAHFQAVATAAGGLPVVIYDIPVRTGRKVAHETILRLAMTSPNIVGLKDAAGDPAATARLISQVPSGFECYAGDDGLTLPLLAVGAIGVISVASHWCGQEMLAMVKAFLAGDISTARQINASLLASYAFESGELSPNPLPTKAILRALSLPAGQCRLPMGIAPLELDAEATALLVDLQTMRAKRSFSGGHLGEDEEPADKISQSKGPE